MKNKIKIFNKINSYNKTLKIEGDKSLSIRWALLASQANGKSRSINILKSEDVLSTLKCLKKLGIKIKFFKDTCEINWQQKTCTVHNHIRGLSPYPAAWFKLNVSEKEFSIKVFSTIKEIALVEKAGIIYTDNKTYFKVSTLDGYINIKELQLSGKKRMKVEDLLRGFKFENCDII